MGQPVNARKEDPENLLRSEWVRLNNNQKIKALKILMEFMNSEGIFLPEARRQRISGRRSGD